MKRGPSIRRIWDFISKCLKLEPFFRRPGDGRKRPQIPAKDLVWAQVTCQILQMTSFHGVERIVRRASSGMFLSRKFSEDSLGYCNERLDPNSTREALAATLKRAKRNKDFHGKPRLGLAIDGTGAGRTHSKTAACELCRPQRDDAGNVVGHRHDLVMICVVGGDLSLPFDVEPYGPGDCELNAGRRIMARSIAALGTRYADYVVADAKFACCGFLNDVRQLGLHAVVRLKDNVPDLHGRAVVRFNSRPPDEVIDVDGEHIEIWDDEEFRPWDGLDWPFVRVIRYRQLRRGGEVIDACWLTSYPKREVGSLTLYRLAKSRWEIENQGGFNEAKTRHGMEHICRHEKNALVVGWLLLLLALVIERLYRIRHLHRGTHQVRTAADLLVVLLLELGRSRIHDTS